MFLLLFFCSILLVINFYLMENPNTRWLSGLISIFIFFVSLVILLSYIIKGHNK